MVTSTLSYRTAASPTPSTPAWASLKVRLAAKDTTTPWRSYLTRNWIVATAMRAGMPVEQLADVEFAYPTFTAIVGIAARRLLRELGLVAVSPRWGIPERTLGAEWEHSDRE